MYVLKNVSILFSFYQTIFIIYNNLIRKENLDGDILGSKRYYIKKPQVVLNSSK